MVLASPGFFGKIPSRGDFISRRLAATLAGSWDNWLGMLTLSAKEAAAEDWPEVWLTAPLWQFVLGADLAPEAGAAGVIIASVDRVGRMFPFSIIGPAIGIPNDSWFDTAEELILSALDDAFDPNILDAALTQLGPPPAGAAIAPNQSLWRCRGSDRVDPTNALLDGLPSRQAAASMVLG
jgi:type VI secretion system protein ImpM